MRQTWESGHIYARRDGRSPRTGQRPRFIICIPIAVKGDPVVQSWDSVTKIEAGFAVPGVIGRTEFQAAGRSTAKNVIYPALHSHWVSYAGEDRPTGKPD